MKAAGRQDGAELRLNVGEHDEIAAAFIERARQMSDAAMADGGDANVMNLAVQLAADSLIRGGAKPADVLMGIGWGLASCLAKSHPRPRSIEPLLDLFRGSIGAAYDRARRAMATLGPEGHA